MNKNMVKILIAFALFGNYQYILSGAFKSPKLAEEFKTNIEKAQKAAEQLKNFMKDADLVRFQVTLLANKLRTLKEQESLNANLNLDVESKSLFNSIDKIIESAETPYIYDLDWKKFTARYAAEKIRINNMGNLTERFLDTLKTLDVTLDDLMLLPRGTTPSSQGGIGYQDNALQNDLMKSLENVHILLSRGSPNVSSIQQVEQALENIAVNGIILEKFRLTDSTVKKDDRKKDDSQQKLFALLQQVFTGLQNTISNDARLKSNDSRLNLVQQKIRNDISQLKTIIATQNDVEDIIKLSRVMNGISEILIDLEKNMK